jgi:hypothetical protein
MHPREVPLQLTGKLRGDGHKARRGARGAVHQEAFSNDDHEPKDATNFALLEWAIHWP